MKSKILVLIIGILIGAIITTLGFLTYNKTVSKNSNQSEMMQKGLMGEPPTKPDGNNREQPPARPENSNNNSNS